MAVRLDHSIFYHIPKTGGVFVTHILKRMPHILMEPEIDGEKGKLNRTGEHVSPIHLKEDVPSFAFLRNPFTWYESFWAYKSAGQNWNDDLCLEDCGSGYFNEFIDMCIDKHPGTLTDLYESYDVDMLGRTEYLRDDLEHILRVLEWVKEKEDVDVIQTHPPMNASSDHRKREIRWGKGQKKRLFDSERGAFDKWMEI